MEYEKPGLQEWITRVEILTHFLDSPTQDFHELLSALPFPASVGKKILELIYTQNYIVIDEGSNSVSLGDQGLRIINSLSDFFVHTPRDTFKEIPLVKGVILSEERGIVFYMYEYKRGFFDQLTPVGRDFPDPTLVSSFLSAVGGFANKIGQDAKIINLTSENAQIISQRYDNLICTFFLEPTPASKSFFNLLQTFVIAFHDQFQSQIARVGTAGDVNQFAQFEDEIIDLIKNLNAELHEQVLRSSPITAPQLISLYQKVDQRGSIQTSQETSNNSFFIMQ